MHSPRQQALGTEQEWITTHVIDDLLMLPYVVDIVNRIFALLPNIVDIVNGVFAFLPDVIDVVDGIFTLLPDVVYIVNGILAVAEVHVLEGGYPQSATSFLPCSWHCLG